jgi:hypothetical protein
LPIAKNNAKADNSSGRALGVKLLRSVPLKYAL